DDLRLLVYYALTERLRVTVSSMAIVKLQRLFREENANDRVRRPVASTAICAALHASNVQLETRPEPRTRAGCRHDRTRTSHALLARDQARRSRRRTCSSIHEYVRCRPSSSEIVGSQLSTFRRRVLSEFRPRTPCGPGMCFFVTRTPAIMATMSTNWLMVTI